MNLCVYMVFDRPMCERKEEKESTEYKEVNTASQACICGFLNNLKSMSETLKDHFKED